MDHMRLFNQIRQRSTLDQAFEYTCHDRMHTDYYVDFFELNYVRNHKSQILDELEAELTSPDAYHQRPAYAFFPPKTDLCFRRMVYLNFRFLTRMYARSEVEAGCPDSGRDYGCSSWRCGIRTPCE